MSDQAHHHQIRELEQSLQYWNALTGDLEDRAAQMQLLAHQLEVESRPFRNIFDQIRYLHTTTTWQGNAALLSRRRLDILEDRCIAEVRRIDHLIDDLEHGATIATRHADAARITRDDIWREIDAKQASLPWRSAEG